MSQTKAKLSKIHTYAEDLERVRETQGHTSIPTKTDDGIQVSKTPEEAVSQNLVANTTPGTQTLPTQAKPAPFTLNKEPLIKEVSKKEIKKTIIKTKPKVSISKPKTTYKQPITKRETSKEVDPQKIIASATKNKTGEIRDNTYEATVITDNKHKRFRLIPAMFNALAEWWSAVTMQAHKKHRPKASIMTDRHKGVVQKATSMTGRSAVADHSQTIARVKESAQQLEENNVKAPTVTETDSEFKKHTAQTKDEEKEIPTTDTETVPDTLPKLLPEKEPELLIEEAHEEPMNIPVVTLPSWGDDDKAEEDTEKAEPEVSVAKIEPIFPIIPELANVPVTLPKPEPEIHIFVSPNIEPIFPAQYDNLKNEEDEYSQSYAIPPSETRQAEDDFAIFEEPEEDEMYLAEPEREPEPIVPTIAELKKLLEEEEKKVAEASQIVPVPTRIMPERITPIIPNGLGVQQTQISSQIPQTSAVTKPQLSEGELPQVSPSQNVPTSKPKATFKILSLTKFLPHLKKFVIGSVAIITIGSIGFIAYTYNLLPHFNSVAEIKGENLFRSSVTRTIVPTSITKEGIMRQLMEAEATDVTVTEIKLLTTFNGEPITGQILSDLLEFTIPAPSKANIESMTFGFYRNTPWILMTVRDAQSIRGGFLQWEVAMPQNLKPLFSISNINNTNNRFIDSTVVNTDVRVLKNNSGQEEVMYGFIRHNTILITTDTRSFLNLQENYTR